MARWTITISGEGAAQGARPHDADLLVARFAAELRAAGHTVTSTAFVVEPEATAPPAASPVARIPTATEAMTMRREAHARADTAARRRSGRPKRETGDAGQ